MIRRRAVRWAVMAVAVPVAAAGVAKLAEVVEQRRGTQSKVARTLRTVSETVRPGRSG